MITSTDSVPAFRVQRSAERAHFDFGWLATSHSFSFAEYYDKTNLHWGALRVLNDDRVAPGGGFPTHGHSNMEIVTYVLEGRLEHLDSTGSQGIVGPGGVQFMSAGRGVRHSEYNYSKAQPLHFLQMWVVPALRDTPPSYGQVEYETDERRGRWLAVASGDAGVDSRVRLTQKATFLVTRLEGGEAVARAFEKDRLGFLFAASGDFTVEGTNSAGESLSSTTLDAGDAIRIADVATLTLAGNGEAVLWDLPPIDLIDEEA